MSAGIGNETPIGALTRSDWTLIRDALDVYDDEAAGSALARERACVLSESLGMVLGDKGGVCDYETIPDPDSPVIAPSLALRP